MTQDRHRRRGWRGDERGQTLHDYVAGISVFILTVTLVIGLLPSVVAPYQGTGNVADATKTDRISDRLVSNLSTASAPNVLNIDLLSNVTNKTNEQLQVRYGLSDHQNVNLSVTSLNGSAIVRNGSGDPLAAGANTVGNDPTSSARVIALSERRPHCQTGCRLIVRVW